MPIMPARRVGAFIAEFLRVKLFIGKNGFVDAVGGQVVETDAGVIKVKLPLVREVEVKKKGMFGWFGPKVVEEIEWVPLDLHMAKKQVGTRTLVEIKVVQPNPAHQHKNFVDIICRELRAYLMVGR